MTIIEMITDPQFVVILIFSIIIVVIAAFLNEVIQTYNDYLTHKKRALNCMGSEMPLSEIRKDKGAGLALKGLIAFSKGEYVKSAELFEKALKENLCEENMAFCFNWLANCYIKLDNDKKHRETRFRAAEALATDDKTLCLYADVLANEGDFKNAEIYYKRAVKYNPNCSHAYRLLGLMASEKGEYKKALGNFDLALKINPHLVDVVYETALCHAALGNMDEAERFMTLAVADDADSSDESYEKYKSKIENIRKIKNGDLRERSTSLD